jgi:uncharacterized protein YcbK (DUF882 family)
MWRALGLMVGLGLSLPWTASTAHAGKPPPAAAFGLGSQKGKPAPTAQARIAKPLQRAPAKAQPTPSVARRKSSAPAYPAVELHAVNLNESLLFRPYDANGKPRKGADKELTRLLRCWHTGKQHRVDARLGRVLYEVGRHYAGHRVEIFSGYRPKAYCTRAHSRHLTASAIDFRVVGVKNEALVAWLRGRFHPVGVGYYPNGIHVHLDVDRAQDAYWVDAGDAPSPNGAPKGPLVALAGGGPGQPLGRPVALADVEATADEALAAGVAAVLEASAAELPAPSAPSSLSSLLGEPPSVDPGFDLD